MGLTLSLSIPDGRSPEILQFQSSFPVEYAQCLSLMPECVVLPSDEKFFVPHIAWSSIWVHLNGVVFQQGRRSIEFA